MDIRAQARALQIEVFETDSDADVTRFLLEDRVITLARTALDHAATGNLAAVVAIARQLFAACEGAAERA